MFQPQASSGWPERTGHHSRRAAALIRCSAGIAMPAAEVVCRAAQQRLKKVSARSPYSTGNTVTSCVHIELPHSHVRPFLCYLGVCSRSIAAGVVHRLANCIKRQGSKPLRPQHSSTRCSGGDPMVASGKSLA